MTKKYIITPAVIELVEALYNEGYEGTAELTRSYPSGIADELDGCFSIQLSGFCKETLHLVVNAETNEMCAFGRYSIEERWPVGEYPVVKDIVRIAFSMFYDYKDRGYSLPHEFRDLLIKYEYMEVKTETVTKVVFKK